MATRYVLRVRKDRREGAYGSVVLQLRRQEHRPEVAWTRAVGSWIQATFRRSRRLVWDLGAGYLVWAPRTDTWLFLYLHCYMWLESYVLHILMGFSPRVCILFYQPIAFLSL